LLYAEPCVSYTVGMSVCLSVLPSRAAALALCQNDAIFAYRQLKEELQITVHPQIRKGSHRASAIKESGAGKFATDC